MASEQKKVKVNKELRKHVATFVEQESNKTSLITVTRCEISSDLKELDVFLSVLPIDKENLVVDFLNRRKKDAREYIKKHVRIRVIPFVNFIIDQGEKNRQNIDQLLRNS